MTTKIQVVAESGIKLKWRWLSLRRAKYSVGSKRTKKISAKMKKEGSKEIKLNIQDMKERSYRSRLIFQYTVKSSDKQLLKYWNYTGDKNLKKSITLEVLAKISIKRIEIIYNASTVRSPQFHNIKTLSF